MSASPIVTPESKAAARPLAHPGIALTLLVTCQIMVTLDGTVVNIALPSIQEGLGFSSAGLAWVTNAYILAFGGLLLFGGRAGDILGRRRLFIGGIAVFTAASLLAGIANDSGTLLTARVIQGIGAAFAAPGTLALVATNFAEGKPRDRALGVVTGAYGVSIVLGMVLGGVLTEWLGWRSVFFINIPIGIALIAMVPLFVNESDRHPGRFDFVGTVLSCAGMAAVVYGFLNAASEGWGDPTTTVCLALGVVLLGVFVAVEARLKHAVMPLYLFRNRTRAASYVSILLLAGPLVGMSFLSSQLLQNVLHYSALRTGVAFLPMCGAMFLGGGLSMVLLPKIGAKAVMLLGMALAIVGLAWFTQLDADVTYLGGVLGPLMILGAGPGFAFTALNQSILSGVPKHDSGAASGLLEAMQWAGSSLGLAVLVSVFGTAMRDAAEHPIAGADPATQARHVLTAGMSSAFLTGALLTVGIVVIVLLFVKGGRPQPPAEEPTPATEDDTATVA
ncbi:MFS transporter [Actinoplanes sp. NPDC026619]|uniref:MFS transporter n=1 Tax=Actinoplanes sp. NPDC026619 TaxID=3155798 RepID=UPI0033D839E1